jgi:hypothetical protein
MQSTRCLSPVASVAAGIGHSSQFQRKVWVPILLSIFLQVTMRRLDRLRSVKNRMVRLNTRVETVRLGWSPWIHAVSAAPCALLAVFAEAPLDMNGC